MRRINREHRAKDATTDVLSFPLYEAVSRAEAGRRRAIPSSYSATS